MNDAYRMLGFAIIAVLYVAIGIMAATGMIGMFRKILAPEAEQRFYAMVLIPVAALYLAFAAYFGAADWHLETIAIAVFIAISLLGLRLPFALVVGYSLHGVWDMVHELQAHGVYSGFETGRLTAIPLAYGFFCAAFDFYVAGYFYRRRLEWNAVRR